MTHSPITPKPLDWIIWNFQISNIYVWSMDCINLYGDVGSRSGSGSSFAISDFLLYLKNYWSDFQFIYIKWKLLFSSTTFITSAKTLDLVLWIRFWHFYFYMDPHDAQRLTKYVTSNSWYSKTTGLIHLNFLDIKHICLVYVLWSFIWWSKIWIRIWIDLSIFRFTPLSQKRLGRF